MVDLIARHYCGILVVLETETAQSRLGGSFIASSRHGHSQLLPNTPHEQQQVPRCMYMWPCYRHAVPTSQVSSCTLFGAKADGGEKKVVQQP